MTQEKASELRICEKTLKQERLAKALRENLLKRKQQQRQKTEQESSLPASEPKM